MSVDCHYRQLAVWVWIHVYGDFDRTIYSLDHINRETMDNRLVNLRLATRSEQQVNRKYR
ncbi:HNH endonuclease [Paracoccus sp. (in: a-proteobacteria)]|uniref:HNH endonuclease n=1 Tax=Paracoccus sp. TaxID=267 RepID=UPI00405836E3